jgi:DNA-binding beta-propeller fold protein YncE
MAYVYNTSIPTSAGFNAQLYDMVMSPDESTIYAVAFQSFATPADTFLVIDTATLAQTGAIDLYTVGGYRGARSIDISPDGATAYVTCFTSNKVIAIDTGTLTIVDSATIPSAGGVAVSPDGTIVWVIKFSNFAGKLYKRDAAALGTDLGVTLSNPFSWPPGPSFDPNTGFLSVIASQDGNFVYIPAWQFTGSGTFNFTGISKVDAVVTDPAMLGLAKSMGEQDQGFSAITISPDGAKLYGVSSLVDTWIFTVDVATLSPTSGKRLGSSNYSVALEMSDDGSTLFIADYFTAAAGGLQTMDTVSGQLSLPYPIPFSFLASVVSLSDMSRVFLGSQQTSAIAVMDVV